MNTENDLEMYIVTVDVVENDEDCDYELLVDEKELERINQLCMDVGNQSAVSAIDTEHITFQLKEVADTNEPFPASENILHHCKTSSHISITQSLEEKENGSVEFSSCNHEQAVGIKTEKNSQEEFSSSNFKTEQNIIPHDINNMYIVQTGIKTEPIDFDGTSEDEGNFYECETFTLSPRLSNATTEDMKFLNIAAKPNSQIQDANPFVTKRSAINNERIQEIHNNAVTPMVSLHSTSFLQLPKPTSPSAVNVQNNTDISCNKLCNFNLQFCTTCDKENKQNRNNSLVKEEKEVSITTDDVDIKPWSSVTEFETKTVLTQSQKNCLSANSEHYTSLLYTVVKSEQNLQQLSENIHMKELKVNMSANCFNCQMCKSVFCRKSDLLSHALIHMKMSEHRTEPQSARHLPISARKKSFDCLESNIEFCASKKPFTHANNHSGKNTSRFLPDNKICISDKCTNSIKIEPSFATIQCHTQNLDQVKFKSQKDIALANSEPTRNSSIILVKNKQKMQPFSKNICMKELKINMSANCFNCPMCKSVFCQESDLFHHALIHRESESFGKLKLYSHSELIEQPMIHTENKEFSTKIYTSGEIPVHCKSHSRETTNEYSSDKDLLIPDSCKVDYVKSNNVERPYECSLCKKTFLTCKHLSMHSKVHDKIKPFTCQICGVTFSMKAHIFKHMKTHFKIKTYTCKICKKTFSRKSELVEHKIIHKRIVNSSSKGNVQVMNNEVQCLVCDATFSHSLDLKDHIKIHTGKKYFRCAQCRKSFYYKSNLIAHLSTHTNRKQYECSECNHRFLTKASLFAHVECHSENKSDKCPVCKKSFPSGYSMTDHLKVHTSEKPYRCSECYKAFSTQTNLAIHSRIHTGEKPFKCDICSKGFKVKCHLVMHLMMHAGNKPFKCPSCTSAFTQKSDLTKHIVIHEEKKPFQCSICKKSFSRKLNLSRHLKGPYVHT